MQYLGGKSRLAKAIAEVVAPRGLWWEPFCGGLSVSVQLAKYGPGIVSDVNPALMALYQAVRDGWQPPQSVSREQYDAAKRLPDSDPLKAFCGFGCSFGAKYFGGFKRPGRRTNNDSARGPRQVFEDSARATCAALYRDIASLQHCDFRCVSFFDDTPAGVETIYADPPYAGTTSYASVAAFQPSMFWERCQEWAARGVRVFVSEYACPIRADEVGTYWAGLRVAGGCAAAVRTERLFRILPPSAARCA